MKSYINHVAYQDLSTAVEKAKEVRESMKLQTQTAEEILKSAQKEGKSKHELSVLELELRCQKLEEHSQKLKQKIAELERNHWVIAFKKSFKKTEKETTKDEAIQTPKKQSEGVTSKAKSMKSKTTKATKATSNNIDMMETPNEVETETTNGVAKLQKQKK